MSEMEQRNFGQLLAYHTAPTLLGIKCTSLVSIERKQDSFTNAANASTNATVSAKPQKKPFNTNIVKTLGFDSRLFGGIDF